MKDGPVPDVVSTIDETRRAIAQARQAGKSIGFVPTMGALHAGHLSLVETARQENDFVVVSIYVNPTQFEQYDDFHHYPRTLDDDRARLAGCADLVFAPSDPVMYPEGFSTYVEPPAIAKHWEGEHRAGHFRGVATVVLKLLLVVQPDRAYFGEKDYQQLLVVRHLVRDLDVPVTIVGCPLVREADGLALSSRNVRLAPDQRRRALGLYQALDAARQAVASGKTDAGQILALMRDHLEAAGVDRIDYVAVVDPATLEPVGRITGPVQALVAAYVGPVRLIDNMRLEPPGDSAPAAPSGRST